MARTRRYIIMKETSYFPDTEAYDEVQKRKAAMKYNLVNVLHPLFLLGVMLLMLWPFLGYPDRYEVLNKCNQNATWNTANQTWDLKAEEKAWTPYYHWARANEQVSQLQQFYIRPNASVFSNTDNSSVLPVVYESYNATPVDAALRIIKPAMDQAYGAWEADYKGLQECADRYVEEGDYSENYKWAIFFGALFTLIFLLSLCVREVFLHNMVKKEYTAAEWKKESHNNMFFICLWLFISLLFLGYLFWMPDRRRAYLHGILARYWSI
uniref:Uncharacterized protein n=1 Tax=Panagrolaimus sp. ES5 TaxID=591445 RepID=A0AC34GU21_9BILA